MKRVLELRGLSNEHHRALVLAKKAKQAGSEESEVMAIWQEIEDYYSAELERHFHLEETYIATPLKNIGETALVGRLYKEHQAIRSYFWPTAARTGVALNEFGVLLERHVRFEERELFHVAQELLDPESLVLLAGVHNQ